ncbi:MAG TPA: BRCT domain-containing protein [Rhizomicrobium sp.]|nr:BRCT domain-containing protein [Rhizomicrobium sp.]
MSEELHRMFGRARLDDRQLNELIGLAHGLIADGTVNQAEAEYLRKWLVANADVNANPVISNLLVRVNQMLQDDVLDAEEGRELFETLRKFSGGDFELGEVLKSSTLPLDEPPPVMTCVDRRFCFTGTFAYGSRADCERAVTDRGGAAGSLTMKTNYLVIGVYATGNWKHSCFGNKIERALELKGEGVPIAIVGETHWAQSVR